MDTQREVIAAHSDGRVGTIVRPNKKGKEDRDEEVNPCVGHLAGLGRDSGCQRHRHGPRVACQPVGRLHISGIEDANVSPVCQWHLVSQNKVGNLTPLDRFVGPRHPLSSVVGRRSA